MGSGIYNAGIPDAPSNGSIYGRQNKAWTIAGGGGSGLWTLIGDYKPSGTGAFSIPAIPATYNLLKLIGVCRTQTVDSNSTPITLQFNQDSGLNYTIQRIFGNVSSPLAQQQVNTSSALIGEAPDFNAYSIVSSSIDLEIPFYADNTFAKTFLSKWLNISGSTSGSTFIISLGGYWNSNAIVNRIDISLASGNFITGSHFRLYGIS